MNPNLIVHLSCLFQPKNLGFIANSALGNMGENHWFEIWILGRRYPEGMALKPELQRHGHRGMTVLGHHCCSAPLGTVDSEGPRLTQGLAAQLGTAD